MNTANLQLEGVYAILSALFGALRDRGVLGAEEIDALLVDVERSLARDPLRPRELRDANFEAICFPARLLRLALRESAAGEAFSFAQLAGRVGQATPPEQAPSEP
ncbi:hypothetical protein IY145_13070 [Methylosinus sp. H3A]|uniref:hypothetical protein n=1 Tax=Methylosinus sp. H3A TaxID=2785786 RepID=UPI0018C1F4D7|nr:hypothetical protein [Methylosinus sp. H3A]MBG0810312.1 hypothetical protein [Methylosinus sp. H3A]